MKALRTLVLSLVFALAVGLYLYQTRLEKQAITRTPDEVNRVFLLEKDDAIDRIEITNHGEKTFMALALIHGQWFVESPVFYPADPAVVEGLAMVLRMASKQTRMRPEKEWEEYGLEKPDIQVNIMVPGKKDEILLLGTPTPIGNAVYARWESERGYFLLPGEIKAVFKQTLYGLREKRVFRALPEKIRKITVEMGAGSFQWKKDDNVWYWLEPLSRFGQKIPTERIQRVLRALQGLFIKEFLDQNKQSKAELGFFIIHDHIRIDLEGGKPEIFHFGNEVPLKNAYYGFREKEDPVFLVDRGKVIALLDLLKDIEKNSEKLQTPMLIGRQASDKP